MLIHADEGDEQGVEIAWVWLQAHGTKGIDQRHLPAAAMRHVARKWDERIERHFDKTHNTYLENIFELGWPVAGILFLCVTWLLLVCWRGVRYRRRDWVYPATGVAATVLVGVHSLFDFSLQMPGTAITYACILGVASAQSYKSRSGPQ